MQYQRIRLALTRSLGAVAATGLLAAVFTAVSPAPTQNAIANGDTRTINLYHTHTGESISATFRVNGQYDKATLDKLNWFLRDWRTDQPTTMSPKLFDVIWETYRETGSREPVQIVSAYRSPATNAMLRRRSRAVAEHSQHMLGKAMDMHYTDVPMSKVREIAMKLQRGGVGYYPTAGTPFVHLDVGSVRAWPRMSYDQLARLFPDGKTVHLPTNGHPLARYEEAKAEIEARGDGPSVAVASSGSGRGFFASLFGGGSSDEDEGAVAPAPRGRARLARVTAADRDDSGAIDTPAQRRGAETLARAERDLPRGETTMGAPAQTVAAADPAGGSRLDAPLPPRRPAELAAVLAAATPDIPLPPVRPLALAALSVPKAEASSTGKDAFPALLARAADLPDVIKQGTEPAATGDLGLMAYAPDPGLGEPVRPVLRSGMARTNSPAIAQAVGVRSGARRKPQLVAARLDRSNFVAFTHPGDMARTMPQTQLGSATGLRAAAKADLHALVFSAAAPVTSEFGPSATDLTVDVFSGPAVRPLLRSGHADASAPGRIGMAALTPR